MKYLLVAMGVATVVAVLLAVTISAYADHHDNRPDCYAEPHTDETHYYSHNRWPRIFRDVNRTKPVQVITILYSESGYAQQDAGPEVYGDGPSWYDGTAQIRPDGTLYGAFNHASYEAVALRDYEANFPAPYFRPSPEITGPEEWYVQFWMALEPVNGQWVGALMCEVEYEWPPS